MQGRLLPKFEGRYQAHPKGYWQDEFPIAAELGLDLIEFILDFDTAEDNPLLAEGGVKKINAAISATGVGVRSICADYFMKAPLHRPETRAESIMVLERLLETASALGVTDIVIPCVDQSRLTDTEDEIRFVSTIEHLLPKVEQTAVNLSLETDLDPKRFRRLLDRLPSPRIKVNYDIGNSASLGYDVKEEIASYGNRISEVHVKDRILGGGSVVLGSGNADIPLAMKLLDDIGFNGSIILQAYRDDKGLGIFRRQLAWLRSSWPPAGAGKPIRRIEGQKIVLEPFSEYYLSENYLAWLRDDMVTRYLVKGGADINMAEVRNFCRSMIESRDDFFFAIVVRDGDRHVGNVRLGPIDWREAITGFGIMIGDREWHGQGLASETIKLITSFAFDELNLSQLRFPVVAEHDAAMRLYRRAGFVEEGPAPTAFSKNGRVLPMVLFSKFNIRSGH